MATYGYAPPEAPRLESLRGCRVVGGWSGPADICHRPIVHVPCSRDPPYSSGYAVCVVRRFWGGAGGHDFPFFGRRLFVFSAALFPVFPHNKKIRSFCLIYY